MTSINVALAGNPNSGKTTLFNGLTGAKHYVGNWAGVTVEKREGSIKFKNRNINIVDLPGTYSLSPYSIEEIVSREYILGDDVDVVLNIVDATNLERNLFLTLQLIELGKPVVLALNMMDEVEKLGQKIDVEMLEKQLGVPIVSITAKKKIGFSELLEKIIDFENLKISEEIRYSNKIEEKIEEFINNYTSTKHNPRWYAIKLLEGDVEIQKQFGISEESGYEEVMSVKKYEFISNALSHSYIAQSVEKRVGNSITDKIDNVLLNPIMGVPIFAVIMSLVFYLTFTVGGIFLEIIDVFFGVTLSSWVTTALEFLNVSDWLISLLVDGVIGGVGGVLTFVPNIALLFVGISFLEDSGYMARVAFIMDEWMKRVGLSGKTFIPMILGFGCNVPAIMSTRTLENENDRLLAILINPFMSCGARLPVYALFASAFFRGYETIVVISLYFLGIIVALGAAFVLRKTILKGDQEPFVMELPTYRLPEIKTLGIHVWERVRGYIIKAGTIIFAASVILWVVLNFNFTGMTDLTNSFGADIGKGISFIFKPLGFGTWQASLSLLTGVIAKEIVVSNMMIVYGLSESATSGMLSSALAGVFTQATAYAFMVFVLLYTPCVAVIGVIKRETNSLKWTLFSVFYQFGIAWFVAMLAYQIGAVLGY